MENFLKEHWGKQKYLEMFTILKCKFTKQPSGCYEWKLEDGKCIKRKIESNGMTRM
jgi:hypothetical protein